MKPYLTIASALLALAALPVAAQAQERNPERNETLRRQAVSAWTACIADEFAGEVDTLLKLDYRTEAYDDLVEDLAERRVSQTCFDAMPRAYRSIRLTGLPFTGGLAERMLLAGEGSEPLVGRLSRAAIGQAPVTYSYTDQVASCAVRGAPDMVAGLFATPVASAEETAAIARLQPVLDVCMRSGAAIEASPLAMRAMLATASYRVLAAQQAPAGEG